MLCELPIALLAKVLIGGLQLLISIECLPQVVFPSMVGRLRLLLHVPVFSSYCLWLGSFGSFEYVRQLSDTGAKTQRFVCVNLLLQVMTGLLLESANGESYKTVEQNEQCSKQQYF